MGALARFSANRPWLVLAIAALLGVVAAVGAHRVHKEDDLLVFLPTEDADVRLFTEVSRRFGSLRVALVGVEVPEGRDVFEAAVLTKIDRAGKAIRNLTGVDRVVSLTTMTDVVGTPDGAEVMPLVPGPPTDDSRHDELRAKALARDHVVGNVVSVDGRAALLMVFLSDVNRDHPIGEDVVEERIRETASRELAGLDVTFGGAPFAGRAIYSEAQRDVWRLSPIALAVLLLVVLLAFRDPVGVLLTIVSVGYAALLVIGGMGWVGERWTVATSTLPVILFASGSSYAVHVLGRYYLVRGADPLLDGRTAIERAMTIVAPPLLIAALTTSAGFFAFAVTDVRPMRAFGVACGTGVLLCWLSSLTIVPAVVALVPRRVSKPLELVWLGDALVALWSFCTRHRVLVLGACAILAAFLARPMLRVRVRMEPRAFFRKGSEPERAEQFLVKRFGGATFVQVALDGDFDQPASLRELARLEDYARSLPRVTQAQSIVAPLTIVSDAMGAGRRLPASTGQASNLYFFLQGEPEVRSLLSDDRKHVVVHVRVDDHGDEVVAALEAYVKKRFAEPRGWPTKDDVAADVAFILTRPTIHAPDLPAMTRAARVLDEPSDLDEELRRRRDRLALVAITSPDAPKLVPTKKASAELAVERQSDGWLALWRDAAIHPDDVDVAAGALRNDLDAARRELAVERAVSAFIEGSGTGDVPPFVRARVARAADDLFSHPVAAAVNVTAAVAGEPVLDRGFSRSIEHGQRLSLIIAIVAVLVFLLALFRSLRLAIVCLLPAMLTLVYELGAMGVAGTNVDLGTSLVAGIATGAGSDFAMHYLWYLRTQSADDVSRSVGPIMVVSVALVAVGFFVLALGRSPVMHLFGGLAGGAMALSALLTCLVLPAALGKDRDRAA